jgi:hypothetical protein
VSREPWLGSRYFQRLSDQELLAWRPSDGNFHEGNYGACNKEVERRAAKAGMPIGQWVNANR